MTIISIDPGYERIGIAVILKDNSSSNEQLLFSECFKTSPKLSIPERLGLIGERIAEVIKEYKPDQMGIENLFMSNNQKTVMGVSQARGVIIYEAIRNGLSVIEFTPLQIKNAITGYGKATKDQVYMMVKQLIDLPENVKQDDEIDAIAVGITAFAYYRF
jgi:crossover junction endodeoxyribonuclease RuvC